MTQTEKWRAKYIADDLADCMNLSAYLEGHSDHDAKFHLDRAYEQFAKLADLMGYTVTKKGGA